MLNLTIITPNLNGVKYLEHCILSVLNQNYKNLTYVIIDGGSSDGSIEIIEKYKVKYEILPQYNNYEAIDYGLRKYKGDIQGWINSDDFYLSGAFSSVSDIFTQYKPIQWVTGIPTRSNDDGALVVRSSSDFPSRSKWTFLLHKKHFIPQDSTFWRSDLYVKSGGLSKTLKVANDYKLWMDFYKYTLLYELPQVLSAFRIHSVDQISIKNEKLYLSEVVAINKETYTNVVVNFCMKFLLLLDYYLINIPVLRLLYYRTHIREKLFQFPKRIILNTVEKLEVD